MSARVLIVDDHDIVRHGIRSILAQSRPDWEICGEAANGQEALQTIEIVKPDVVIMDVTMPIMNGLEAASRIREVGFSCRILVCTMHESESLSTEVRRVGAHGWIHKSRAARDLVTAIEKLLSGGTFFGSDSSSAYEKG